MNRGFVIALLLVVVVFVVGVFVGSAWRGSGSSSVEKMIKQSELDTESFLVERELFEGFDTSCDLAEARLAELSEDLWRLGKVLSGADAEQQLGKEDYNFLKRKFHLMQARIYILYKRLADNCGVGIDVVLFYFERNDNLSTEQGLVLDSLVADYGLKVFAMEYNYSKDLGFMEEYYAVDKTPLLVINYDYKLGGLSSAEDILAVIHG